MARKLLALLLIATLTISLVPVIASASSPDPITFTVFIGDPYDQPNSNNKILKKIKDELGISFEFEFLAGDLDETLGIKVAGQDYADLMCGSNSAEDLISAGALIDLTDYITPEKTPNLWAHYEPYFKRMQWSDGGIYVLPNYGRYYNGEIKNYCNGPAFWIQKKVMAWAGYPEIKTLDQYFDLLLRFKEANPVDENGTPYSGFEVLCDDWRSFCLRNPVQHLMGHPNDGDVIVWWNEDYRTEAFINKPYAKAYYKKLNDVYQLGLINQDTFVQSYDQYIAKVSSGTVLGMFDQFWDFQSATNALVDAEQYDDTYVGLPLVYDESIKEQYLDQNVLNINRGYGISINCKNPERIIAMFEEFLNDDWQTLFAWGVEGEDYYVENGRYLRTPEQKSAWEDTVLMNTNRLRQLSENLPKKQGIMDNGNSWDSGLQPELYFDQMPQYDKDFLTQYGKKTFAEFFNVAPANEPYYPAWQIDRTVAPDVDDIYTQFVTIQRRDLPQIIMADPAEFDAKWDTFVKTVEDLPISEFEQFMEDAVKALNEKLS